MEFDPSKFDPSKIDPRVVRRLIVGGVLFLLFVLVTQSFSVKNMKPSQVAVIVNNATGGLTLRKKSGAIVYCPYFQDIYILDKTVQTLEMTAQVGRGDRAGIDDVKIKTFDGSDVNVDITINYEINPDEAELVLMTSGSGESFKWKWIRDYARSVCRNKFGTLTTEEFYDSEKRRLKARAALVELNTKLNPFGISVSSVIPQNFNFYKEYQAKIKEKKLADQEIEEQKSLAKAAIERQKKVMTEEKNKMKVAIAHFRGEMQKQRIEAEAERDRVIGSSDAYAIKFTAEADAEYIVLKNKAKASLATKKAEAEGIKELAKAFEGPGGLNLVRMEYAKRLKNLRITGTPVSIANEMDKLELRNAGAAGAITSPKFQPRAPRQ